MTNLIKCWFCGGKGWYWKDKEDIPISMLPSGNFSRIGNEIKTTCFICEGEKVVPEDDKWNIKKRRKEK